MKGTVTVQSTGGKFALETPTPGEVQQRVLDELVQAKSNAADYAKAFGDAVKAQADKYKVKPGALRKYVTALEADKVEDVKAEADDLVNLIG